MSLLSNKNITLEDEVTEWFDKAIKKLTILHE
jgi:hypothetical protein